MHFQIHPGYFILKRFFLKEIQVKCHEIYIGNFCVTNCDYLLLQKKNVENLTFLYLPVTTMSYNLK